MAKYAELKSRIRELEVKLHMRELEVADAHAMCDKLDVPRSKSGALVGHRLYWYYEGKRESYKTKENTEGYAPDEWEQRKQKLEEVLKGKVTRAKSANLNILPDEI